MEGSPAKQSQGRKGEQHVSSPFGADVGRLREGKVDQMFSENHLNSARTPSPGPNGSKACTPF